MTLRRVAAQVSCRDAKELIDQALGPHQVRCGRRGGAEAAVHSARAFLNSRSAPTVVVKLDFANAFNSVRRDHMLVQVAQQAPELFNLDEQSYCQPSTLLLSSHVITSASGVQQGDPLGLALF